MTSLGVSGESIYVIRGDLSLPSDAVKISTLIETHNVTKEGRSSTIFAEIFWRSQRDIFGNTHIFKD